MSVTRVSSAQKPYRIGIDVGGTFTDVLLVGEDRGDIHVAKVPTVPQDPSDGCIDGFERALTDHRIAPGQLAFAVHGTTIATNTIIQGRGAKAGLITSQGFRDVLEIAYQTRPSLYDVFFVKPAPLIPRYLCRGVPERIGPRGEVIAPLDEDAVREAAAFLGRHGVEAVVIAFLHSYHSPVHERRAGEIVRQVLPGTAVILSSDVSPEYREYPRTSTAVVNGVLVPKVSPYLANLEAKLADRGMAIGLHLMTSSGGIIAAETAKQLPVTLVESGPAAGVIGAAFVAALAGFQDILALDIGGTTAKAAVVTGGEPQISDQFEVGSQAVASVTAHRGQGYPVRTPVISLIEIGAGGGSIAQLDPGGALTVGPESAGAAPGPAAYGAGGRMPTLTDANVVLKRIDPDYFLGGQKTLHPELADQAVRGHVAEPLGMMLEEAASAVVDIANAKMTSALNFISVDQGIDPRRYVLVASGGAGPMQAVAIARALGVRTVLIPPTPGLNSALGLLATDLKHEQVRTYLRNLADIDTRHVNAALNEMAESMRRLLAAEGVPPDRIEITRQFDMCYVGQSHNLRVAVAGELDEAGAARAGADFHEAHRSAYGFCSPGEPIQISSLRLLAVGRVARPRLRELPERDGAAPAFRKGARSVYFSEAGGRVDTLVVDREHLRRGDTFDGPAIVEQMDATTVIPPGAGARVDRFGNLIITTGSSAGPP